MTDLTPDHVAELASRLYNESPGGHEPSGMTQAPTAPIDPAADSSFREQVQAPSFPLPNDGVPGSHSQIHVPILNSPSPTATLGDGNPGDGFRPPAALGRFSDRIPTTSAPVAESQTDGLRAFVQNIRRSDYRSSTEAFPAEKPDSPASVRPAPARQQTSHLGYGDPVPYARDDRANGYGARALDVDAVRQDFPILHQRVHGRPLAWLDNAATTQKPQSVIDTLSHFYERDNSNIHRAAHTLAARATDAFEQARDKVRDFLGASSSKEIVFVRGTTEAINLVAQTWGRKFLQPNDEIILSTLEHHANIVPWQFVAKETGARLRVIPVNDRGEIILEDYQSLLGPRTKLVAIAHASNSLGTLLPVAEMTQMAKRYGARVLIDGAQTVAHVPVNVQQLGSDFYVFSGHKIFGPTGIGVLHAREELLEIMPPWQGGGSMIKNVTFEETTFAEPPAKFEAGTPNIADAVGLGSALDYVTQFGLPNIAKYEHELLEYTTEQLSRINGLRLIGTAREKVGVISFVLKNRKTEEVGRMLDLEGIAVRAGHHCSQPSLRRFGVEATVRPSLAFYNTVGEIDRLAEAIRRIQRM
ncbi:MAG TPA: SufS family cysteine desulfurase [Planctomycetaceae bacterium]|jgi:cysteine desulfurase/selenocysteine lyase|nr:SufS family cysteine desulfurase [Planctomycetaceae bacterium]